MKIKNKIKKIIIAIIAISFIIGTANNFVLADSEKTLRIEYFRYVDGNYSNGYALNTIGTGTHHPIFQILSSTNNTNFYCLNATASDTWRNGTVSAGVTYNASYDLETEKNNISTLDSVYSNVLNANYNQILWLLNNFYIPSNNATQNLESKKALLAKAGIIKKEIPREGMNGETLDPDVIYIYQGDYQFATIGKSGAGYSYTDSEENVHSEILPDEIVEAVQQSAIWYFTNYLNNNPTNDTTYNAYIEPSAPSGTNWLYSSNGTDNTNSDTWTTLANLYNSNTDDTGNPVEIGKWYQEMASILYDYLVDSAKAYNPSGNNSGLPLSINETTVANEKNVSNTNYYVLGPITITDNNVGPYTIANAITVKDGNSTITGSYISDENGNRVSDQTVANHVGSNKSFYIAVPKNSVTGNNIQVEFDASYDTVEKLLWTAIGAEQPIVEVTPKNKPLPLKVVAPISKQFDLALRKVIKSVNGNQNYINEAGRTATRSMNIVANDIANNGTATYNHRKDPVVVKKDDIIVYELRIYNEGDINGYATQIIDKLPTGLDIVGGNTGTLTGTYTSLNGNTENSTYSYTYNSGTHLLTLTNSSKNILEAYNNGNNLAYETINIQCKVTQVPSTQKKFLTNIAYISGMHNSESNQDITEDRDSQTTSSPSATQETTEDTYTGYHGGNNNNGDNNKNVYNDGTNNNDYFPGRQDDDDFEVIVIKPAEFDLALKKYIMDYLDPKAEITSTNLKGRQGPTINTKKLADGTEKTATYTLDKTPILVKSGYYLTYRFNVYNEGEIDGYVKEITDNIPEGLQFVTSTQNTGNTTLQAVNSDGTTESITANSSLYNYVMKHNGYWTLNENKDSFNGKQTMSIKCNVDEYLTDTNQDKLLSAYQDDSSRNYDGSGLDNVYVTAVFRVSAPNGKGIELRNEAAITDAEDTEGNKQDTENSPLKDRDSQTKPTGTVTNPWPGKDGDKKYQDDEDYDRVILEKVDLALTKFIAAVSDDQEIENGEWLTQNKNKGSKENPYDRETKVDSRGLKAGTSTNATYVQNKNLPPLEVEKGKYLLYNIRVYNEGEVDAYAEEITDYLPNYLDFVECEFNRERGWHKDDTNNKIVKTDYLKYQENSTKNLIKAYNKTTDDGEGSGLEYKDIQVLCMVNGQTPSETKLINTAEITDIKDKDGDKTEDRDSTPDNINDNKNKEERKEDDDDYEVVKIKPIVDLALTKFIAAVSTDEKIENGEWLTQNKNKGSKENPYDRATSVNTVNLRDDATCHDATYTKIKTPLEVEKESYVLYDIRVYNEGETDVYAGEVTDYLPNYLDFVEGDFNQNFGWNNPSGDKKTISTTYLGYNNGNNTDNLLKAFNKQDDDGKGSGLDYRDLQVLCKVNDQAPTDTKMINSSAVTKYEKPNGEEIKKDVDSDSDKLKDEEKNKEKNYQDDDDYDVIKVKPVVDLALTKFITAISDDSKIEDGEWLTANKKEGNKENPYDRATEVDTSKLRNPDSTAIYKQIKTPLYIPEKSYVLYNIRVYNEGETDVYAGEITDYLPNYLDYVDGEFNRNRGWSNPSGDGKTIKTSYLGYNNGNNTNNLLKAFDKAKDDGKGSGLDYRDVQVLCRINNDAPEETNLVNSAAVTKYENKDGEEIKEDVDSDSKELTDEQKNKEQRNQDDDDYEVVKIKKKIVDLALTKFIAAISNDVNIENGEYLTPNKNEGSKENPYDRATAVDTTKLRDDATCHDAEYTRVKTPLVVPAQSYVLYDIRVYNEGDIDVYAGKVTDYLPNYLDYVDCEQNRKNGWSNPSGDGKTIETTALGYNNGNNTTNLLKAFDRVNDDGKGSGLDYRDLQIVCKVSDNAPSAKNLINSAAVTKYEDKDGKDIKEDIDSDNKELSDDQKNKEQRYQDDDDWEVIQVKTFDLSLIKYVSTVYVTEDGKTTTTQTNNTGDNSTDTIPKVEINRKKLNSTIVKFGYTIKVTNEGDIAGYAKELTDYVPQGLKFYEEDNSGWEDKGNNVITTRLLENTLLQPGESAQVTVIFRWENGSNNLGQKINIAEISEDHNDEGVPDRDSTPGNKVEGEDDIDDAPVLLSISTGLVINLVKYATIGLVILTIFAGGIILIKKYVL